MRWILVFLFLYLIPLIALFRNYRNFKRSCIYSSIYIVLVSTIVITNIYISGLNKIEESMYYRNYAYEDQYNDKYASNFDKPFSQQDKANELNEKDLNKVVSEKEKSEEKSEIDSNKGNNLADTKSIGNVEIDKKEDKDIILDFKKEIYNIELVALIPMRDCMPYTKDVAKNITNLVNIKKDLEYANQKCKEVIGIYDSMDIPSLSTDEYTKVLDSARNDIKKAYELRAKAMELSLKLVDSKNPKYIGKITEYLNLSDNHITNFKERLSDLNLRIEKNKSVYK